MKYQKLGNTDLNVSKLALGTWALGGDWGEDVQPGVDAVGRAYELGINFFDTAYAYGKEGMAELRLAEGLGNLMQTNREELVIATKGGLENIGSAGYVRNSDSDYLRYTLEQSLTNLGTDYVDIYFIHWPDPTVPFEESAKAMQGFVDEGLVKYVGLSNFSVEETEQFKIGGSADIVQLPYNLLSREIESGKLPYAHENNMGVMAWSSLFHGILTGALSRGQQFNEDDWRSQDPRFQGEKFDQLMEALEELKSFAKDRNCTLAQLSLAWINSQNVIPIIGAQIPEHIESSVGAVDVDLSSEEIQEISSMAEKAPSMSLIDQALPASR